MNNKLKIIINSIILLIIDIVIKLIISNKLIFNQSIKVINNFFYITYVKNTGVAWSILSGKINLIIVITLIIIAILIIYIFNKKSYSVLEIISYSMILSGSIGNLIDRIIYGYVIDYLDFVIFKFNFAIFNLADAAIVIGAILLIVFEGSDNDGRKNKDRSRKLRKE